MAVTITQAGESLIARLQAEGKPLIIDRFVLANVPGQDPAKNIDRKAGLPANVVHTAVIPEEYRAFVNPNQVVYSCLLGSDIGDFTFNWQGLYCEEHKTLVAAATFPALTKRAYNGASYTPGNNLTRNFMLSFSGVRDLTQITIEAKVWQLDFTVRLKGIDERERLSNRDLYGRAAFLDQGWKLARSGDAYSLQPGVGYIEGVRIALDTALPVTPPFFPCDVWLDVCMEPQGLDVVTTVTPLFLAPGKNQADYTTPAPYRITHYVEKVGSIPAKGSEPENLQPGGFLDEATSLQLVNTASLIRLSDRVTRNALAIITQR